MLLAIGTLNKIYVWESSMILANVRTQIQNVMLNLIVPCHIKCSSGAGCTNVI